MDALVNTVFLRGERELYRNLQRPRLDQPLLDGRKRLYNYQCWTRPILVGLHAPYLIAVPTLCGVSPEDPQKPTAGMSLWHDLVDWLGGGHSSLPRPDR